MLRLFEELLIIGSCVNKSSCKSLYTARLIEVSLNYSLKNKNARKGSLELKGIVFVSLKQGFSNIIHSGTPLIVNHSIKQIITDVLLIYFTNKLFKY